MPKTTDWIKDWSSKEMMKIPYVPVDKGGLPKESREKIRKIIDKKWYSEEELEEIKEKFLEIVKKRNIREIDIRRVFFERHK